MTYIALLRGINVGGKNKVKMEELRALCQRLGLEKVRTYIQSGNLLFQSEENETALARRLEENFITAFGFATSFILRSAREWEKALACCPFTREEMERAAILAAASHEYLYVSFLKSFPPDGALSQLRHEGPDGIYHLVGREVYLLYYKSIREAKLGGDLHSLKMPATVRNWKTIQKLSALAKEISTP